MSDDSMKPVSSVVNKIPTASEANIQKYQEDRELKNNLENWKKVKAWVDNNDELDVSLAATVDPRISGKHGKDEHLLDLYVYTFPPKYPHIDVTYSWARCKKCNETRWIKKEAWFNGNQAICYDRYTKRTSQ